MARWIERPKQYQRTRYYHKFTRKDCPYRGFSFESDKDGNIPEKDKTGFRECLEDPNLKYEGREEDTWTVYSLGTIKCHCGAKLKLYSYWANSCSCGNEYDADGGLLAPREFWGEETGEVF